MNIIVCVKQVPATTQVEMDEETGVLKRGTVSGKLNPYDLFAIEAALELCKRFGGQVRALSMGPQQARTALLEAVYMGADSGVLVSDRHFGGADVLATAYTLSQAVRKMQPFDMLICGKQTTDGDTAQVGAEMAEFLGLPHANNVLSVDEANGNSTIVKVNLDSGIVTQRMPLPCVLCMESDINTPHLPSYKRLKQTEGDPVTTYTLADLEDSDERNYGLMGSPTQVERIFPPEVSSEKQMHTGTSAELTDVMYGVLRDGKFI